MLFDSYLYVTSSSWISVLLNVHHSGVQVSVTQTIRKFLATLTQGF